MNHACQYVFRPAQKKFYLPSIKCNEPDNIALTFYDENDIIVS